MRDLLDAQRSAFARQPPGYAERLDALRRLEAALLARQDDIVAAVSRDFGGRAAEETRALELFPLLLEIRHACRQLKGWMAPRRVPVAWPFWPARARVVYRPLGVAGILAPWNYPIFLSLGPLVGAIAAGNHVLLKPSELAPATAALIKSMLSELYPQAYVSVILGGPEIAAELTRLPLVCLLFTGSARVGKEVMKAASENLVPVTLELGGKSPAIIHAEYPVERAGARIVVSKLFNAGQTCVAPDYVLIPRERRDEFVATARRLIARMFPTLTDNPDYTRIISGQHYRRLTSLVEDARRRGAEIIEIKSPEDACDETTRVFPPTLVLNVRDEMDIMREEIFGPVLPIVEYDRLESAAAYVNARPHPLALYYFDHDRTRIRDIVTGVTAGGVTINDCMYHVGQAGLPFGGVGASGIGRYHGFDGFETFSHKKGVYQQPRWSPLGLLKPPYDALARKAVTFLLRHG